MKKKSTKQRASRFRIFRVFLLAGILLTIALIFLISTIGSQQFGSMHKLTLEAVGPLQKVVTISSSWVARFKSEYIDIT